MTIYSPNMLKTFKSCPKKYYFKYIQKISLPQKASFFEKGKKVHALANYYLRGDDISKMEKTLTPTEKEIWERLKNNEFFQMNYLNSEYNLSCKIENYWIGGRLDAVVCQNAGVQKDRSEYQTQRGIEAKRQRPLQEMSLAAQPLSCPAACYILDYKTGSIPKNPEYDYQTMVYLLCLSQRTRGQEGRKASNLHVMNLEPECPSALVTSKIKLDCRVTDVPRNDDTNLATLKISFVYIDLKNNENRVIDFTPQKLLEYEKAITDICGQIENTIFSEEIKHSKMCEFCEYRKICN